MIYKCEVCGFEFDEEKEGKSFRDLDRCPVCKVDKINLKPPENAKTFTTPQPDSTAPEAGAFLYSKDFEREDPTERHMADIHEMALKGKSIIDAMSIKGVKPSWDDILFVGNQLNPPPLDEHHEIDLKTVIGKNAKKPLIIESPVYISHMSFGALSKESKTALAKGSAMAKTAMCSGEGGILPEERENSYKYIFEYVPNLYSVNDENLKNSDAIEIKIGQGTKPGMGGHLPGEKVTEEIAKIRGKEIGKDIISPSKFPNINSKEDLKNLVDELRERSEGRPIGIKISAGRIEKDLEFVVFSGADFVTIDGRGGATGASPKLIRDSTTVPTIYALHRAKKYLDSVNSDIDIVITGGFRVSSDFAKAVAMGAKAVAIASAALIALACRQYRICGTGKCPLGVATQDEDLRKRFDTENSALRLFNFFSVTNEELRTYARITGHEKIHDLSTDDIFTVNKEISEFTDITHA